MRRLDDNFKVFLGLLLVAVWIGFVVYLIGKKLYWW